MAQLLEFKPMSAKDEPEEELADPKDTLDALEQVEMWAEIAMDGFPSGSLQETALVRIMEAASALKTCL